MLTLTPPFPFLPGEFRIKRAVEGWELRECAALRRAVFCEEQKIFDADDRDDIDRRAIPIAAIACLLGMPEQVVGTVRVHALEEDVWQGSRLAVQRPYRRTAELGTELIRHAVGTAHGLGCRRFLAHVQEQNVVLFRRLGWRTLGEQILHGRLHHFMEADLALYPPRGDVEVVLATALRQAA